MTIFKTIEGKGESIVLLHGWSHDHTHMEPVTAELAKHYSIESFDLPGLGQSSWNANIHTIHDIADLILPHLPKNAVYIGWSFGGLVSMSIAARYPKHVKRFIGITTTPKFIETDDWLGLPRPGFRHFFEPMIKEKGFKSFVKEFYDGEFAEFNPKPKTYMRLLELLENFPAPDLATYFEGIDICDAIDLRQEFQSIKCPIDLILGEKDDSLAETAIDQIRKLNPNTNIHMIKDAKHLPFWTHQKEFNEILNGILI